MRLTKQAYFFFISPGLFRTKETPFWDNGKHLVASCVQQVHMASRFIQVSVTSSGTTAFSGYRHNLHIIGCITFSFARVRKFDSIYFKMRYRSCAKSEKQNVPKDALSLHILISSSVIFPLTDLRSEVTTRTNELKNATLRSSIASTTLSDFYTDNSVFLLELNPLLRGPPDGSSGTV